MALNTGVPLVDFLSTMQELLSQVAPSFNDEKSLPKNDVPPRYVWVLDETGSKFPRSASGSNPTRILMTDLQRIDVHCWGFEPDATDELLHKARALRLRQALLTALRQVAQPEQYNVLRTVQKGGDSTKHRGWVCIVELEVHLPVFEAVWSGSPAAPGPMAKGVVEDLRRWGTVRPTTVGFDTTPATTGDGEIHAGET
jgi:hypothetical protein